MNKERFMELVEQDRLEEAIRELQQPFKHQLAYVDFAFHERFPNISFSCFDYAADLMCIDACDDGCSWVSGSGSCCFCLTCLIFALSGGKCCFPCIDNCCGDCC